MIAVQEVEETVDILALEPADVITIVDVARRWTNQHEPLEAVRLLDGGENADHSAHRMADEDSVCQVELATDLQYVLRVAVQGIMPRPIISRGIRLPMTNMVEQNDLVAVRKGRRDEPPHVLVAAISVSEDHRLRTAPGNLNIVSLENSRHWYSAGGWDQTCAARAQRPGQAKVTYDLYPHKARIPPALQSLDYFVCDSGAMLRVSVSHPQ
jgi:hypothetical protein